MNYAFLLDENVENDVVLLSLELDRDSGLYTEKYEMLAKDWHAQSFYARLNLQDHNVESMLKFARFSAFDKEHGDVSVLERAKEEAEQDPEQQNTFHGYLPVTSKENELAAWAFIEKCADDQMSKYRDTIEDDDFILDEDDKAHKLSYNIRNCIMYRRSEKIILKFLKDYSIKLRSLLEMRKSDALKSLERWFV